MRSLRRTEADKTAVNTAIRDTQAQLRGSTPIDGSPEFAGDVSFTGTATFANTGLHILDSNATHDLIISPGSNITADRTLTLTTGDANRTLDLGANLTIPADPNADRFLFWDDSAGATAYLTPGNGLTVTTTTVDVDSASTTVDGIAELCTDAEAQAMSDTARVVTASNLAAIDAVQSDQETGTSTTRFVTPAVQQHHSSAAKAWGVITGGGTPALAAGYNVATVTDSGTGLVTVDLTTAFSSTNYVVVASVISASSVVTNLGVKVTITDADTFTLRAEIADGTDTDPSVGFSFVCYGDQA